MSDDFKPTDFIDLDDGQGPLSWRLTSILWTLLLAYLVSAGIWATGCWIVSVWTS